MSVVLNQAESGEGNKNKNKPEKQWQEEPEQAAAEKAGQEPKKLRQEECTF